MDIQDFEEYNNVKWFNVNQTYTTRQVINKIVNSSYAVSHDMERLIYRKFLEYLSVIDLKNDFDVIIVDDDSAVILSRNSSYALVIDTSANNIEDVDYMPVSSIAETIIGKKIIDYYIKMFGKDYVKHVFDVEV